MLLLEDKLYNVFNNSNFCEDFCYFVDECDEVSCNFADDVNDAADSLYDKFSSWDIRMGASKYVILLPNYNYVIKIPFNGSGETDYDDETDEEQFEFEKFDGAALSNGWDYCAVEATIYEYAELEGVEKYFARTVLWKRSKFNYPLYLQERVNVYNDEEISENSREIAETYAGYSNAFGTCSLYDEEWIGHFLDWYGEEEYKKLANFLINEDINDLHYGNLGYRNDGAPVIFDYSGYRG